MDAEAKTSLWWMFAWAGIPLSFAGIAQLTYSILWHRPPHTSNPADWVCLGLMFGFLTAGIFLVRERLRPRETWVAPAYAGTMLVLLLLILAFISLPFVGV